jgi:plastocyanin
MALHILTAILIAFAGSVSLQAADIEGIVVITRQLTKRKVTAPAGSYHRGVAVELGSDPEEDGLAFERRHVAVYLEGSVASTPLTATMEQKNRRFTPDFLVVPAGSTVSFPNLDPIFHNVFSLSKPKTFDLGNYPKDQTRTVTFTKPGIVFIHCHLHPNMAAAIVVTPNQWSTKADASGRFVLRDVAPGEYTIVAWHKSAGFFRQSVRVAENRASTVEFLIPLSDEGPAGAAGER